MQGFGSALQLMLARHDAALQALPSTAARPADLQLELQPGRDLSLIEVRPPQSPGNQYTHCSPPAISATCAMEWKPNSVLMFAFMYDHQLPEATGCAGGRVNRDAAPGAAGSGWPVLQCQRHER